MLSFTGPSNTRDIRIKKQGNPADSLDGDAKSASVGMAVCTPLELSLVRGIFCMSFGVHSRLLGSSAIFALMVSGALFPLPAAAQQQVAANSDIETVVVTSTQFNPDVAPAKSSLEAMEPQTIINQSYIQDSVANTADYAPPFLPSRPA